MILNDVHSQLNATEVAGVERPADLSALREVVKRTKHLRSSISVGGSRHAMGGQQFAAQRIHVDMRSLDRVLRADSERGLLHIEAGACWPKIISATQAMKGLDGTPWAIRQKQTGVDEVTLGGSISANAHGRGLLMQPLAADIEELTLIDAEGEIVVCSRAQNSELFSLAVGGYGLFGLIYSATLRLTPRRRVQRLVDILDLADAMNAVHRRVSQGCLYGDFQFVIDPDDDSFLHRGVFACYQPVAEVASDVDASADLSSETWLRLLQLAHEDKSQAFSLYSQHYLRTHGSRYWSDTMQLGTYIPTYADYLESHRKVAAASEAKETLVIGEHYVPRENIAIFMAEAARILKSRRVEVIYGTIRAILRDECSFLAWAKADFACVIFNLRTPHTPEGKARTADAFRALIASALDLGGSYFLTYHNYATREQVLRAYPQFPAFLERKRHFDPETRFTSRWYDHHRELIEG